MDDDLTLEILGPHRSPGSPAGSEAAGPEAAGFEGAGPGSAGPGGAPRGRRPGRRWTATAVGVGVAVLAGVVLAGQLVPEDPWPGVMVLLPVSDPLGSMRVERPAATWTAGPDGRPRGGVRFETRAVVTRSPSAPGERGTATVPLRVLGFEGPGVGGGQDGPVDVPASGASVEVPLAADVDCSRVPDRVPDSAYRLRLQAGTAASRTPELPAGGRVWGQAVQAACAAWRARRDLTVTGVTAVTHPGDAGTRLALSVTNAGEYAATLDRAADDGAVVGFSVTGGAPLVVPPHGTATGMFDVTAAGCSASAPDGGRAVPFTSLVGVVASAAPAAPVAAGSPAVPARGDGLDGLEGPVPTGVVLVPDAARALRQALADACGGLEPPPLNVDARSIHLDPQTGNVVLDAAVRVPAGRVRSVELRAVDTLIEALGDADTSGCGPLSLSLRNGDSTVAPDAGGVARFRLHFSVSLPPSPCTPTFVIVPSPLVTLTTAPGAAGPAARAVPFRVTWGADAAVTAALLRRSPGWA